MFQCKLFHVSFYFGSDRFVKKKLSRNGLGFEFLVWTVSLQDILGFLFLFVEWCGIPNHPVRNTGVSRLHVFQHG